MLRPSGYSVPSCGMGDVSLARAFCLTTLLLQKIVCHHEMPRYLSEKNVSIFFSSPYCSECESVDLNSQTSGSKSFTSDIEHSAIILNCTTKEEFDLFRGNFGSTVHSLKVANCIIRRIDDLTAIQIIAQRISDLEFRFTNVSFSRNALAPFSETLDVLAFYSCPIQGDLNVASLHSLSKLVMHRSELYRLPEGVTALAKMSHLDLSSNYIQDINVNDANWPVLTWLSLSDNLLSGHKDLSSILSAAPLLKGIDLSNNLISSLSMLKTSLHLRFLNLSSNRIHSLDWVLSERIFAHVAMDVLDLSYNRISSLMKTHVSALQLTNYVDLSYNSLSTLDITLRECSLPLSLVLHGNDWVCDCKMMWLSTSEEFGQLDLPYCESPPENRAFQINNFPSTECIISSDYYYVGQLMAFSSLKNYYHKAIQWETLVIIWAAIAGAFFIGLIIYKRVTKAPGPSSF